MYVIRHNRAKEVLVFYQISQNKGQHCMLPGITGKNKSVSNRMYKHKAATNRMYMNKTAMRCTGTRQSATECTRIRQLATGVQEPNSKQ